MVTSPNASAHLLLDESVSITVPTNHSRTNEYVAANELHEPMRFRVYFLIDNSVPYFIKTQLPSGPYFNDFTLILFLLKFLTIL